jgi:hypothetical protein
VQEAIFEEPHLDGWTAEIPDQFLDPPEHGLVERQVLQVLPDQPLDPRVHRPEPDLCPAHRLRPEEKTE